MRKYTVAAEIIELKDKSPIWMGNVEVEASNKAQAVQAAKQRLDLKSPVPLPDRPTSVQILRVQLHGRAFLEGEVDGLQEYGADFSPDGRYRYGLYRVWDKAGPLFMCIGLNPSTADVKVNDPTVRRCIGMAKRDDYGGLIMCNAFAFRATSPDELRVTTDPIGPENDAWLQKLAAKARIVVAAWGNHASYLGRSKQIRQLLGTLHCFGKTNQGEPRHPLYLSAREPLLPLD